MPRANRHFLPGHVWHITHRCHQKKFLLKFARDRRCYLRWVFEAIHARISGSNLGLCNSQSACALWGLAMQHLSCL